MTPTAFFLHLSFAFGLFLVSLLTTRYILRHFKVIDIPGARSSHSVPTPKSGGVSIVVTFLLGVILIFCFADATMIPRRHFLGFVFSALLIAGISLYDDVKNKPFLIKLAAQCLAAFLVLAFGLVIDEVALPWVGNVPLGFWGYPLSFLWIVGLTNAFNFMDGLDGLMGGVGVIVSAFFCAITFFQGSTFVYITSYTLLAGTAGFLLYNFPPARIFMGDVGSAFLGFAFAVLAIIAARYDHSHTSFFVMPLLMFNIIYDTTFTFFRRLIRGERVFDAHRSHLYQLFQQSGFSHRAVTLFHYGVCLMQGGAAFWMVQIPGDRRLFVFLPFLLFQAAYTLVILRMAKTRGIV